MRNLFTSVMIYLLFVLCSSVEAQTISKNLSPELNWKSSLSISNTPIVPVSSEAKVFSLANKKVHTITVCFNSQAERNAWSGDFAWWCNATNRLIVSDSYFTSSQCAECFPVYCYFAKYDDPIIVESLKQKDIEFKRPDGKILESVFRF